MIEADASAWLELWERAASGSPRQRRHELLACSGTSGARGAEQLEIGRANAHLLRLHRSMFGPRLACSVECPSCKDVLEIDVDADQLLARAPAQPATLMQLQIADWEVSFRLPTEGDVDAVLGHGDRAMAGSALMSRCVAACRRGAEDTPLAVAPPELGVRIAAQIEHSDPLAILDFELRCASCEHVWSSMLEVDRLLWAQLDAWAHRLAHDVSTLAKVYGWSERAILEMSPSRRQLYLDLVDE